jgi:hypothetical protein
MTLLRSKFRTGLDNPAVKDSEVTKIKLSPPFPQKPKLWILYFFGKEENVVRTWYYDCQKKRQKDLDQVLEQCSHLTVV